MVKLSAIQLNSKANVEHNLRVISEQLAQLTAAEPQDNINHIVVLPECCLFFGANDKAQLHLAKSTSTAQSPKNNVLQQAVSHLAKQYQVTLIAENCYPVPHCEQIAPTMLACYFDDWTDSIVFTKGPEGTTQYSQSDLVIDIRPDLENRRLGMESHVALYPNPSNNIIQVEGYGVEVLYLYIYDDAGKLVLEPGSNSIIDVKPIERGSYYVKIITSEGVETKKLIVQ